MTMFVAVDQNGRLITIERALRGLACKCICVSCGEAVIARKGLIREHHFAHYSNKESCYIQRESLLHLYAKEVICDVLGLQLPPLPGVHPISEDSSAWWDFKKVTPEVPQPGFKPDLVAELKDGTQLFIEVAVTSFIDEVKREQIKAAGTWTIELDLRNLLSSPHSIPSEPVKEYILNHAHHKTWVYPEEPRIVLSSANYWPGLPTSKAEIPSPASELIEHRFTIMGMWVSARTLQSGSIAVRSWSFNPQIAELFKTWRNQLGGEYNAKYRSWIFYAKSRNEIIARLRQLNQK
ncbi:competence protein CoiA family protein [Pseudomonas resinovorans]|uniref:competence protein CoiA family protein n=1 Tax=Metapseudomonas resinovorans TaxID=53412 RepID=UPI00237F284F|nr:competence protein CoiA family protein [Pseudomonas resinovorans]MDE3736406.1 competence protein CoiA family protein [Pseudomonas resinovorans]